MTILRKSITDEAVTWISTPFVHQGRIKGVGVDCVGLIAGVAAKVGYTPDVPSNYPVYPDHVMLDKFCNQLLAKPKRQGLANALPGDVLSFATNDPRYATHLAWAVLLNGRLSLLHVLATSGTHTCMHRVMPPWTTRYIATWVLPDVEKPEG